MGHINFVGSSQREMDDDLKQILGIEGIPFSSLPGGSSKKFPLVGVMYVLFWKNRFFNALIHVI